MRISILLQLVVNTSDPSGIPQFSVLTPRYFVSGPMLTSLPVQASGSADISVLCSVFPVAPTDAMDEENGVEVAPVNGEVREITFINFKIIVFVENVFKVSSAWQPRGTSVAWATFRRPPRPRGPAS